LYRVRMYRVRRRKKRLESSEEKTDIVPIEELESMTVKEAIERLGLNPLSPVGVMDANQVVTVASKAGEIYGSAIYEFISAIRRRDLPFKTRVVKATKAASAIITMLLRAKDVVDVLDEVEMQVLKGKGRNVRVKDVDKILKELVKEER